MMDGILLIDKPKGWTSFDVVAKVRGILRTEARKQEVENSRQKLVTNSSLLVTKKVKVGHTGTLDPLATGLLIIVVGSYCKRAQEFSKLDKTYEAELTLGLVSTTDDGEGEKTKKSDMIPSQEEVQAVLNTFVGKQMQLPPTFSAIKIGGKRAYKLAREGKQVIIEPRSVTIYSISEVIYDYPIIKFTVKVSSGTYIRSLARDIGEKLGTGAYMSALRRTSVGTYCIEDSISLDSFNIAEIHTA
jgi:tRNA pseudouridine55 synthase